MNNWNHFLLSEGARPHAERLVDFGQTLTARQLADGFVAPIGGLGLIGVGGDDAATFLHGQLTNDVEHLTVAEARLAAYCTPKGRVMASFLMWRNESMIFLQLPAELQAPLQKRLQMFVLRAKAKLADVSAAPDSEVVLGLGGAKAEAILAARFGAVPAAPYGKLDHALGTLIRLADAFGAPRYQWLTSQDTAQSAWPQLRAGLCAAGDDAWRLAAVHAGVPQITAATQDQFVPQMINFELLGAVNFKKGCYPGQEIVARSQYLGKLKRRTTLVAIADPAAKPGDEVFALADPAQPCGMVVNVAPNGLGGVDALVEMKLAAIGDGAALAGSVRLGSTEGAPLQFLAMPYALDALDL
ncbi:MAG: folate-binding protein [Pseudomonadota bacterium]